MSTEQQDSATFRDCVLSELRQMPDQDYRRVVRIVESIKCHPVRLAVSPRDAERVNLHVSMEVPDVNDESHRMTRIETSECWTLAARPAAEIVKFAIEIAQEVLVHEFLEWVQVDGDRAFDPHLSDEEHDRRIHAAAFRVAVKQEAMQ